MRYLHSAVFAILVLSACKGAPVPQGVITQVVRDESNRAVPNPRVTSPTDNVKVSDTGEGVFQITGFTPGSPLVLTASAPGYTARTMVLHPPAKGSNSLTLVANLRPVDQLRAVTLPEAGQPPVVIESTRDDGRAALAIGANILVTPNGAFATGDANVSMTYWHPRKGLQSAPAPTLTANPNGGDVPATLLSWGMTSIEIEQNGQLLQVAPGKSLSLDWVVPEQMSSLVGNAHFPQPDLYYLNRDTGLWDLVASLGSTQVQYTASDRTVHTLLPHLSEWNLDGLDETGGVGNQACVRGTALNWCAGRRPLANSSITLWFLAWEELSSLTVPTGADGTWCLNHASRNVMPGESAANSDLISFYVSGPSGGSANSSICARDPIPPTCQACAPLRATNGCCRYQVDYQVRVPFVEVYPDSWAPYIGGMTCNQYFSQGWDASAISVDMCTDVCPQLQPNSAPMSNFLPCHICPGTTPPNGGSCYGDMNQPNTNLGYDNNCVDLDQVFGPVTVSDGSCAPPPGGMPLPPPCSPKKAGDGCNAADANPCCSRDFECRDNVCVGAEGDAVTQKQRP